MRRGGDENVVRYAAPAEDEEEEEEMDLEENQPLSEVVFQIDNFNLCIFVLNSVGVLIFNLLTFFVFEYTFEFEYFVCLNIFQCLNPSCAFISFVFEYDSI